jgi:hypothetical protein
VTDMGAPQEAEDPMETEDWEKAKTSSEDQGSEEPDETEDTVSD